MKIYKIEFNCLGNACSYYEVGKNGVVDIVVHPAQGDGDKWYWTIVFEDKHEETLFNINAAFSIPK